MQCGPLRRFQRAGCVLREAVLQTQRMMHEGGKRHAQCSQHIGRHCSKRQSIDQRDISIERCKNISRCRKIGRGRKRK